MNSRRYTMTSLSIVFLAVAIISVSALGENAYAMHHAASGPGLSLSADGSGDTIAVSGHSDRGDLDVTIVVSNDMAIKDIAQVSVSGGSYSASFNVSNYADGTYTIAANQGDSSKYSVSVDVDVSGGSSDSSVSASTITVTGATIEEVDAADVDMRGLTISADAIEGATTIDVSGTTDRDGEISLIVTAPNGNVVSIDQVTPSGGSYMTTITVGGALWSQDGWYTISASQADASMYKASTEVDIKDGHVVPEIGTIAIMILVVAIV